MQWARYSVSPVRKEKKYVDKRCCTIFNKTFPFLASISNLPGKQERAKEVINEFRCGMMNAFSVYTCIYLGRWSTSDTFVYASYCFHAHHSEEKKNIY